MKKLIAMMGAVAMAFGLYADGLKNTVGFEDGAYTAGSKIDVTKGDDGATTQAPVWSATDPTETGTVTAYGTDTKYDYGTQPVIVTDGPGKQFLALETAGLFRNITAGGTASGLANGDVFFDTLVKLSATDGLSVPELSNDAKIAIWAGTDEDNNPGVTNLYVTAAAGATGEAKPEAANFTISVGDDFDFDAWHRITVRSLVANTDDAKVAGFVVFVDGVQVACSDEDYADKLGEGLTLTTEAAKFAAQKQLFIGLVYGTDATMLTALGFSGTGAADDVAITDAANAPQFAKGEKVFTLTWNPEQVTGVKVNETDAGDTGSFTLPLDDSVTTVTIAGKPVSGFMITELTSDVGDVDGMVITDVTESATAQLKSAAVAYTIDGTPYADFESALEAAIDAGEPTTIKVAATGAGWTDMAEIIEADADVTLDLNGKTLTFADYEVETVFYASAGKLTVIDSVGGGKIAVTLADGYTSFAGVFYAEEAGTITIGAAEGDEGITVDGQAVADLNGGKIYFGSFSKDDNNAETLAALLADGENYEIAENGNYWTVQEKQAKNFIIEIVGGDKYESIADALAAAENGDTLKLLKDVAEKMVVRADLTITLDMNGKTLQNAVPGYTIDNAGNLTVVDSADTKGTITHLTADTSSTIRNLGTLVISDITVGGTYIGVKNDEGVGCNGGKGYGELTLNGVTYNGDDQAVQNWGKATLNGGTFGGAVFTWASNANEGNVAGETTILGGTFNAAVAAANTYYNDTWPTKDALVTIKGGTFNGKVYGTYTTNYQGEEPVRGKIVVVGEIASETINPAQFTYDASAYCEEGYETVKLEGADYYTVQKKEEQAVKPGEPVGLGNPGSMTEEQAQAAAAKLPIVIDQEDIDAGLRVDAVTVKVELRNGAWMAVLEPKTAPVVDETMAVEVDEDTFSATVKNPVPGVYYGFVAADSLDGTAEFKPVGKYVRAQEGDVKIGLDAPKGKGNACFYKLNAALRDPTAK